MLQDDEENDSVQLNGWELEDSSTEKCVDIELAGKVLVMLWWVLSWWQEEKDAQASSWSPAEMLTGDTQIRVWAQNRASTQLEEEEHDKCQSGEWR